MQLKVLTYLLFLLTIVSACQSKQQEEKKQAKKSQLEALAPGEQAVRMAIGKSGVIPFEPDQSQSTLTISDSLLVIDVLDLDGKRRMVIEAYSPTIGKKSYGQFFNFGVDPKGKYGLISLTNFDGSHADEVLQLATGEVRISKADVASGSINIQILGSVDVEGAPRGTRAQQIKARLRFRNLKLVDLRTRF